MNNNIQIKRLFFIYRQMCIFVLQIGKRYDIIVHSDKISDYQKSQNAAQKGGDL